MASRGWPRPGTWSGRRTTSTSRCWRRPRTWVASSRSATWRGSPSTRARSRSSPVGPRPCAWLARSGWRPSWSRPWSPRPPCSAGAGSGPCRAASSWGSPPTCGPWRPATCCRRQASCACPLDRVIPTTQVGDDVSVGEFISKRVGREVVDRLVEPLLGGVYAGRADALSMQATMPALFREMRHDRSLLNATRRVAGGGMEAAGARRGLPFRGVVGGVGRVPGAMAAALVGSGVQIRTRATVRRLSATSTGWELEIGPATAPELLHADGVVLATPAAPAARLLAEVAPTVAIELSGIDAASVAVIALAFRSEDVRTRLTGSGLLIPPVGGQGAQGRDVSRPQVGMAGAVRRARGPAPPARLARSARRHRADAALGRGARGPGRHRPGRPLGDRGNARSTRG